MAYTQNLWLIGASFAVPVLCFLAAVFVRWRHRAYFVFIVVVGMVLAVGANPTPIPSSVGLGLQVLMVDTTAGLALRSTDRATPLVILGLAMFLGAGVTRGGRPGAPHRADHRRVRPGRRWPAATAPLWTGRHHRQRLHPAGGTPRSTCARRPPPSTPSHPGTRVYALPGNNFAAYRWGDTIDTVYPGLMTRPFVTHEQQIMGSLATADTLQAVDTPVQDGTMDWNALAPMASLMSAGDVLVQYDQAYERYDTANPQQVASELATTPAGLLDPVSYGTPRPNVPLVPHFDEAALARPPNQGWTAPAGLLHGGRSPTRGPDRVDRPPLVVDGDASGIVNAASVGLLAGNPSILYAGTLDTDQALRKATLAGPADLVVTDTNRKRAIEWNTLSENTGYTETAVQGPDTTNPADEPLNLFPKAPADAQSTAVLRGHRLGHRLVLRHPRSPTSPRTGPSAPSTATPRRPGWTTPSPRPTGQWWQVVLDRPPTETSLTLVQPQTGDPDRSITRVTITFDGRHPVSVPLGPASLTPRARWSRFPSRTFTTLRITIDRRARGRPGRPGDLAQLGRLRRGGDPRRAATRSSPCPRTCCGRPGRPPPTTG